MDFLAYALRALITGFLPVGVLAFALSWWALHRGILEEKSDFNALKKEISEFGKRQKKAEEKKKLNPVHDKWFKFGGGFYGLVGLYTYVLVEWREIVDLVVGLPSLVLKFDIDVLINFFIESLTNFITAVTWPMYWLERGSSQYLWVWIVLAYAGYWAGIKLALRRMD